MLPSSLRHHFLRAPGRRIFHASRRAHEAIPAELSAKSRHTFPTALWLRDVCPCPRCVDPSTSQKLFQTSDLPLDIEAKVIEATNTTFKVAWTNDLPMYGPEHVSTYQEEMIDTYGAPMKMGIEGFGAGALQVKLRLWDKTEMESGIMFIDFADYNASEDAVFEVLKQLKMYGLVFIRGVPSEENAVEAIANRIGHLRETFYGRTWDVKSVPQAQNVAYTNQYLGFHMDLLYMSDPPGLQLLHCLKNSCKGGSSMFSDAFKAAQTVRDTNLNAYKTLHECGQTFHYKNAGQHYRFTRPVISHTWQGELEYINWSPPFQAPFKSQDFPSTAFPQYVKAAKAFSSAVEAPENIYEYRMHAGDCVIFNNRRILHARREFDTSSGERWLKGAYLDTDVFNSRYRNLFERAQQPRKAGAD